MALIVHKFVNAVVDDPAAVAAGEVVPSNWNDDHDVTGFLANGNTWIGKQIFNTASVRMGTLTASRALVSDANKDIISSVTTLTELAFVSGVTSSIQTQLDSKQSSALTNGHIFVGNGSNVATDVAMSGDVTISNTGATSFTLSNPHTWSVSQTFFGINVTEYSAGNSSTAITIDWTNGYAQKVTMTGNCTFTLSNPTTNGWYYLRLLQDGTGSRSGAWPAAVKWFGGDTAPTLSGANQTDMATMFWDGTNYWASFALNA